MVLEQGGFDGRRDCKVSEVMESEVATVYSLDGERRLIAEMDTKHSKEEVLNIPEDALFIDHHLSHFPAGNHTYHHCVRIGPCASPWPTICSPAATSESKTQNPGTIDIPPPLVPSTGSGWAIRPTPNCPQTARQQPWLRHTWLTFFEPGAVGDEQPASSGSRGA
jgi:hypothetical protein